jgi:pimeloyl-ACP methyl ester carboxylesterase
MDWVKVAIGVVALVLAFGYLAETIGEMRDRVRFPPPGQMIDVGGRRLHLFCKGSASGPTVVIEQGAGSPSILWWPVQDSVAEFARVCTYDRAGYQWSDPAPRSWSVEERVAELHALLAGAKVPGPCVLVGHSYGGPLVRLFARYHPDEVAGMVLVDTPEEAVIFRASYDRYARQGRVIALVGEGAARFGVVRLVLMMLRKVPDGMSADAWHAVKAHVARPGFFRAMGDDPASLSRVPADMRGPGGFGKLRDQPLIVITHGQPFPGPAAVLEDGWADGQRRLTGLSTHGALVVAERSNHMVQSDQPELVVDAIRRVVAGRVGIIGVH